MADVAVDFAVKLLGVAVEEIKHLRGVRDDMQWLQRELQRMRCFLLDAERRSSSGEEAVRNWVREITDAAYEAEDIAAKFVSREGLGFRTTMKRYAFRLKELHDIGNDIKRLKEKMVEIGQSRERYVIRISGSSSSGDVGGSRSDNIVREWRRRPLFQDEEHVVGLENEKKRVVELLYAEERRCYVIGVVGIGGMGKTTLARMVFNSIDRRQFSKRAWLDLSQNYMLNQSNAVHRLLIEIAKQVRSADSPYKEGMSTEELSELVKANLKDGRYLIIMDDMWETDVWDLMKEHLPDVENGSRILITTRKNNVAEHPALHFPPHLMEGLDKRQSWDLFTRLVFEDEEHVRRDCTGQLKQLAEELVDGCEGSPLALTVLGALLGGKEKSHSAWRDAVGSDKWLRREAGKNCLEILKLSYMDLPHHLKLCFLYLSAFPEGHKIDVEKLIRLWVAEGFVDKTDSDHEQTLECIARTYLDDLKQRCLIMVHDEFLSQNNIFMSSFSGLYLHCVYCSIHDNIRELSIKEAKKANFMSSEMEDGRNGRVHRLSLQDNFSSDAVVDANRVSPSLRTLLSFTTAREVPVAFEQFCLLRVLDLEDARIRELSDKVGDLVLLRYLSIKGTWCSSLPHSLSRLSYLETLDCRTKLGCMVPNSIWKIKALKHVYGKFRDIDRVDLSYFIKLQTLGTVKGQEILDSIHHMINLQELNIVLDYESRTTVWEALQSLPSLKILSLWHLDTTHLVNKNTGFPRLQRLTLAESRFRSWEVEKGSMPSLEILVLNGGSNLTCLPSGLAYCKKLLKVYHYLMKGEFDEWLDKSKKETDWKFHHVQFRTLWKDLEFKWFT